MHQTRRLRPLTRALKKFAAWAGIASALFALPAFAQDETAADEAARELPPEKRFQRDGLYAQLGAGFSLDMKYARVLAERGVGDYDIAGSPGIDARIGARYDEWTASELQIQYMTGFTASDQSGPTPTDAFNYQILNVSSNLRISLPLRRFQPFIIAGIGFSWVNVDAIAPPFPDFRDIQFMTRAGGGLDFFFSERIALSLETTYVIPMGKLDDYQHLSMMAGLRYQF